MYKRQAQYDVFIYVTNGSYFISKAKKNYIFAMYPLKSLYKRSPLTWYKLRNYSVIANGDFTAERIKDWLKPVSYTHLDVYKRQSQDLLAEKYL